MSTTFTQLSSCSPSSHDNAYIYQIAPLANGRMVATTSADEVLVVGVREAQLSPSDVLLMKGAPNGLTALSLGDQGNELYVGDQSGNVSHFDVRAGGKTGAIDIGRGVTALNCRGFDLAVGSEVKQQQALISVWDVRQNHMRWQNAEINDDVTAIDFHPSQENLLLIGGDDGLVSLFDLIIVEEDDNLIQAISHGPIHKAGFLHSDALFALSSDQNLALHPVYSPSRKQEPAPILLGDLRPIVPCEYVIDLVRTVAGFAVAAGSHSTSRVDLVSIQDGKLDLSRTITLNGAHGEDIVRSLVVDEQSGVVFTAGEDGCIKSFGPV